MRRAVLAVAVAAATTVPAFAQSALRPNAQPPFSWWKSDVFRRELNLTTDQRGRIDKIWETTRAELKAEWDELSRLEDKLSRMIRSDADETTVSRQIDRVETARATANKTRLLMLVQMRNTLLPDQRKRLDTNYSRWQEEQKKLDDQKKSPSAGPSDP
jgi:Spy/CpxP family protein refolding chaperone